MILATLFIPSKEPKESARWLKLFDLWLERSIEATKAQIVVLTPALAEGDMPEPSSGVCFMRVDTSFYKPRRIAQENGLLFDLKGEILATALPVLGDNVLYLDLDAFLTKDPFPLLPAGHGVMLPPDANRKLMKFKFNREQLRRGCAGILWFPGQHKAAVENFRNCRHNLSIGGYGDDWLLEQWSWTWAAHKTGGLLPSRFNYVPHLDFNGPQGEAVVRHHHGPKKWELLENGTI